jgi:hypothetical protein
LCFISNAPVRCSEDNPPRSGHSARGGDLIGLSDILGQVSVKRAADYDSLIFRSATRVSFSMALLHAIRGF